MTTEWQVVTMFAMTLIAALEFAALLGLWIQVGMLRNRCENLAAANMRFLKEKLSGDFPAKPLLEEFGERAVNLDREFQLGREEEKTERGTEDDKAHRDT